MWKLSLVLDERSAEEWVAACARPSWKRNPLARFRISIQGFATRAGVRMENVPLLLKEYRRVAAPRDLVRLIVKHDLGRTRTGRMPQLSKELEGTGIVGDMLRRVGTAFAAIMTTTR